MKKIKVITLASTALIIINCLTSTHLAQEKPKEEKQFSSLWEGKLNAGSVSLRIVLKIFNNADGSFGAFLDSPDQGAADIPISSIIFTEDSLKFEIKRILGKYEGAIVKDSALIKGKWSQLGSSLPLDLKKIEKLTVVNRPQTPQKPYPYNEEEITFENKSANITLAGSFSYPKGEGKYPAVVMVTGSGAQDRDETIFSHKPFAVIADYFARNGIATLRFDDRGVGKSKGNFASATSEDFATDALAAVEYLKTRKEADQNKIGIAGHSEGGLIAPLVAVNSSDVDFIILLAGTGLPGKDILLMQTELISAAEGQKETITKKYVRFAEKVYDVINKEENNSLAADEIKKIYNEYLTTLTEEEKAALINSQEIFESNLKAITSLWFRFFLKYDPRPTLENVIIPVLALNGEKDLQVPSKINLSEIEKALKNGGNKNYKIIELPGLNHLFQNCKTGAVSKYGQIEETFSPVVLKIMKDWIWEVTGK